MCILGVRGSGMWGSGMRYAPHGHSPYKAINEQRSGNVTCRIAGVSCKGKWPQSQVGGQLGGQKGSWWNIGIKHKALLAIVGPSRIEKEMAWSGC